MKIRNMEEEDLDKAAGIFIEQAVHIKNLDDPYCDKEAVISYHELHVKFKQYLSELYKNQKALIIVCEDKHEIVGFLIGEIVTCRVPGFISKVKNVGYIHEAHVLPAYRRKGILKGMEKEIISFFKKHSISYIELNYFDANDVAKKAWEALGYATYFKYARKSI